MGAFRGNVEFIRSLLAKPAPLDQILAAFVTCFYAMDEWLEGRSLSAEERQRFDESIKSVIVGLEEINRLIPAIKLEGNLRFSREALQKGNPADGIVYFLARTCDGVRAPIAQIRFDDTTTAAYMLLLGTMTSAVSELDSLF